jgi:hypothetical protein
MSSTLSDALGQSLVVAAEGMALAAKTEKGARNFRHQSDMRCRRF